MNSRFFPRFRPLAAVGVAVATAGLSSLAAAQPAVATQPVTNGGARQWIAFDPTGREIGTVNYLSKIVQTSNQANAYTISYEPQHLVFCAGTLAPGATALCGTQPTQHLSAGYFQVIAQQAVLMGGHTDMPTIGYVEDVHGVFGADTSHGTIQNVPLI